MLRTTLLRLPNIMLILRRSSRLPVSRQARNSSSNSTSSAIRNARAQISELALRLLLLALSILLLASTLQVLSSQLAHTPTTAHKLQLKQQAANINTEKEHTSEPISPPTASFADPTVWFQLPSVRFGSSLVTAPDEEADKFPILAVACEASFSRSALDFLASPAFWSAVLPVR